MIKIEKFEYQQTEKVGIEHVLKDEESKKGMRVIIEEVLFEGQDYEGDIEFIDKAIEKLDEERQRLVNLKNKRLEKSFDKNLETNIDNIQDIIDSKTKQNKSQKRKNEDLDQAIGI